jgi:hypothetical protein
MKLLRPVVPNRPAPMSLRTAARSPAGALSNPLGPSGKVGVLTTFAPLWWAATRSALLGERTVGAPVATSPLKPKTAIGTATATDTNLRRGLASPRDLATQNFEGPAVSFGGDHRKALQDGSGAHPPGRRPEKSLRLGSRVKLPEPPKSVFVEAHFIVAHFLVRTARPALGKATDGLQ